MQKGHISVYLHAKWVFKHIGTGSFKNTITSIDLVASILPLHMCLLITLNLFDQFGWDISGVGLLPRGRLFSLSCLCVMSLSVTKANEVLVQG